MAHTPPIRRSPSMQSHARQIGPVGLFVIRLLTVTALPLALVLGPCASWAADPTSVALRVLLGSNDPSQPAASASAPQLSDNAQRRTITVMRGESLDRLIRRAMPGMPLHPDFLRQAFVRVNPQVFPKGAPHAMRTGTTLQVPTPDELRFLLLSQHPEAVSLFQVVETTKAAEPEPGLPKRQWVRFP